jgi:hypothetical protein
MRRYKLGLRLWIALSSVVGFFGGWALLAHSPKPAPPEPQPVQVELAPLPTLDPIPSLNDRNNGFQQLPDLPPVRMSSPRLRTGGS